MCLCAFRIILTLVCVCKYVYWILFWFSCSQLSSDIELSDETISAPTIALCAHTNYFHIIYEKYTICVDKNSWLKKLTKRNRKRKSQQQNQGKMKCV